MVVYVHVTLTIVKGWHGKDGTKGREEVRSPTQRRGDDVMEMDNVSPERKSP